MICPQCQTEMPPPKKRGFLAKAFAAVVLQQADAFLPLTTYYCRQCGASVTVSDYGAPFKMEDLNDYRKNVVQQLDFCEKRPGGFTNPMTPEMLTDQVARCRIFLRIIDAMTPEERLQPERIGPAERARLTADCQAGPDDVELLLTVFHRFREGYHIVKDKTLWQMASASKKHLILMLVSVLLAIAAGVLGLFSSAVAAGLSFLGYYFVGAVTVWLGLTQIKNASGNVYSSRARLLFFVVLLPTIIAAGLYSLLHDRVAISAYGMVPAAVGCAVVFGLASIALAFCDGKVSYWKIMCRVRMQQTPANRDAHGS